MKENIKSVFFLINKNYLLNIVAQVSIKRLDLDKRIANIFFNSQLYINIHVFHTNHIFFVKLSVSVCEVKW